MNTTIKANNRDELVQIIDEEIYKHGNNCSLNHIDTSEVKDMNYLFIRSKFNGDISKWDVSNVINMVEMFYKSKCKCDISGWKPYKLEYFNLMFVKLKMDIPYWSEIHTLKERKKAIDTYHSYKYLDNELSSNNIIEKSRIKL